MPDVPRELKESEWPDELKRVLESARISFHNHGEGLEDELQAMIFAGRNVIAPLLDTKDELAELMIQLAEEGHEEICYLTEAWTVQMDRKKPKEMAQAMAMSKEQQLHTHPDRVEILLVNYYSASKEIMARAEISKGESGRSLGPWKVLLTPQRSGRFSNIFLKAQARKGDMN